MYDRTYSTHLREILSPDGQGKRDLRILSVVRTVRNDQVLQGLRLWLRGPEGTECGVHSCDISQANPSQSTGAL